MLFIGIFSMAVLGYDNKVNNGTVAVPDGCNYIVALCVGTVDPPYFNGALMQTYGSVPAQGNLKAIGVHILPNSYSGVTLPFVMNGADSISFIYLDDSVCTRVPPVQGYNASGSVTGDLATSTNDYVFGIVLGTNGQVLIKGDTVELTLVYDTSTCRIGYIVPGDSSLTCLATDENAASGKWYTPPAYYVNTTTSVLVEEEHYETTKVYHDITWVYKYSAFPGYDIYEKYIDSTATGTTQAVPQGNPAPSNSYYYTYEQVWIPDRYETISSGYWVYPPAEWVTTGTPGQISCIFISIADTMIGVNYISRPRIN